MSLLLNLPEDIIRELLIEWIEYYGVTALDTSLCSSKLRPLYLKLVSGLSQTCTPVMNEYENFYRWLHCRGIVIKYLSMTGNELSMHRFTSVENFSCNCTDMKCLITIQLTINYCQCLKSIELYLSSVIYLIDKSILHQIEELCVNNSYMPRGGIDAIKDNCVNLIKLELYDNDEKFNEDKYDLLRRNPKLTYVAFMTSMSIERIFDLCPMIDTIRVLGDMNSLVHIGNAIKAKRPIKCIECEWSWYEIINGDKQLRVAKYNSLSELLNYLSSFNGLHAVYFEYLDAVDESAIDVILGHSSVTLKEFGIFDSSVMMNSVVKRMFSKCCNLTQLTVRNESIYDIDEILEKNMCLKLKNLLLDGEDIDCRIVIKLLEYCPTLEMCSLFLVFNDEVFSLKEIIYKYYNSGRKIKCAFYSSQWLLKRLEFSNGYFYGEDVDIYLTEEDVRKREKNSN